MIKDTVRLILFLECNMSCSYCCNEQEQFNTQFIQKSITEIEFSNYKNVCISGGEPFLRPGLVYETMDLIPDDKNIFIYTNGTCIKDKDILKLLGYKNLICLNIGLHHINQLKKVDEKIQEYLPVRFMCRDINQKLFIESYPDRLNYENTKPWKLNDCNMPNEDWVLLKQSGNSAIRQFAN